MTWLSIQCATNFLLNKNARILGENDPDGSPGPSFWIAGSHEGNLVALHVDVPDDVADQILGLATTEPVFLADAPRNFDAYAELLAFGPEPTSIEFGLSYELP